jgi:5'-nucleotidase
VGDLTVVAPDRNWSASGHAKTMHKPLRADRGQLANGIPAFITDGRPADAIALGLMELAPSKVDLVVTGINRGANLGHDVTYSGTVTAAMEGAIAGLPSIAVSLNSYDADADYAVAAAFAASLARRVLKRGLPEKVLLDVNVPALPEEKIRGVKVTRMGLRIYHDELVRRVDPYGRPYYWIGGDPPTGLEEPGTDVGALSAGYISVTPIQLDFTAYAFMEELRSWDIPALRWEPGR